MTPSVQLPPSSSKSTATSAPLNRPGATRAETSRDQVGEGLEFDAVIFDMDGVITRTATVHSTAWKQMFDEYLRLREQRYGEPFREFRHVEDYLTHVDGRPRVRGVETFLKSRGITLPLGNPDDAETCETVSGLGNRKNALFNRILEVDGVGLYDSTIDLIHALLKSGVHVGLATSSKNSAIILAKTQTAALFETVVDGLVSERLSLRGKPEPDIFVKAAENLGVPCHRSIVVEDAVSGVKAGASGRFGLVIGVARENNSLELLDHGADLVVRDLSEISVPDINHLVRAKRTGVCIHISPSR